MENIKVSLNSNGCTSINNYKAIVNNKKIIYNEECKVVIDYTNDLIIKRENDDYLMKFTFISGKATKCNYYLKKENKVVSLNVITDYVIIDNNLIIVKYNIEETKNDVIYRLEILK